MCKYQQWYFFLLKKSNIVGMEHKIIDLHCHSAFSDGALSPQELLVKAEKADVRLLALTDHDTISGVELLQKAAIGTNIRIINGIEFSTRWKKHEIHILGLNFDLNHQVLNDLIAMQQESRYIRSQHIAERLSDKGIDNALEKAQQVAGHDTVGRPHFAQVLINEGKATNIQNAFDRFLKRGRSAYVPTPWISIEEAIQAIISANGDAIIAHPLKYGLTRTKRHELILQFKKAGGVGIEVVSGRTSIQEMKELADICQQYDLVASSGSDFHYDHSNSVSLGHQPKLPLTCTPIWWRWES